MGGYGTREGVMGWMWYKGGCDAGVVQGRM